MLGIKAAGLTSSQCDFLLRHLCSGIYSCLCKCFVLCRKCPERFF